MFILFLRSEAKFVTWRPFTHRWSSFPCPNKIDRFVHNDGDRKTKFLSLSLRYCYKSKIEYLSCIFDKINLGKLCQLDSSHFYTALAAFKNDGRFKSGQKWSKVVKSGQKWSKVVKSGQNKVKSDSKMIFPLC